MILFNDNIVESASLNICRLIFQKTFRKNHNIDIHVIFVYLADEKRRIRPWSAFSFISYIANVISI